MTENQLQDSVRELAKVFGWLHYHTHNSKGSEPGFPDSVMVRGKRIVFAELKSEDGTVTDAQDEWLMALRTAGIETHVWRPGHWKSGQIEKLLR